VRILHTSDWHLGRSFHRVDLIAAQATVLDHLVEVARAERVDAVVVAGDVYDRALPGVDAVTLLNDTLVRLVDLGVTVVVSSGNHDSAGRLGFLSRVLARSGVHLRTDPARVGEPVLLADEHGDVAVYPLPYLEPSLTADVLGAERTHAGVLAAAAGRVRADLASRPAGTRSVVAAHAFLAGGAPSDSERELAVGGVVSAPVGVFDGVDYVALGHLHGRQTLGPSVRYAGSPLAYSFSEAGHTKGSWLVALGRDGVEAVEAVDAPVPRPLARLRGRLEDLLADPRHAAAESAWCQVVLTDAVRPSSPMEQVRRRFPHTLELRLEPALAPGQEGGDPGYAARIAGRGDVEVCCGFLEHVRGGRPSTPAETALFREALEAGLLAEIEADAPRRRADRDQKELAAAGQERLAGFDAVAGEEPAPAGDERRSRPA
jgi:exonuclease SbcD